MSIFSILFETKIKDWFRKKSSPDYVPPKAPENTLGGKAYEGHLLDDVESLLLQASREEDSDERERLLSEARNLEIQLIASLEKQGLNLMSQNIQKNIHQYKKELL